MKLEKQMDMNSGIVGYHHGRRFYCSYDLPSCRHTSFCSFSCSRHLNHHDTVKMATSNGNLLTEIRMSALDDGAEKVGKAFVAEEQSQVLQV